MIQNILINSPGAKTPIQLVDGLPDLGGFTDPTLSVLRAAFDIGDYEIIPDTEPVSEPQSPNYPGFNAYMLTNPMFKYYRDIVRGIDGDLNSALFDGYGLVERNGVEAFALVWGAWVQVSGIVSADKEAIAMMAQSFNLPTEFIEVIRG